MDIEGLRLINEGTPSQCQVDYFFLTDFPDCLEDFLSFLRNLIYFLN